GAVPARSGTRNGAAGGGRADRGGRVVGRLRARAAGGRGPRGGAAATRRPPPPAAPPALPARRRGSRRPGGGVPPPPRPAGRLSHCDKATTPGLSLVATCEVKPPALP